MQRTILGFAAAALVGALALSAIDAVPAQAAPAKQQKAGEAVTFDLSARRRHHRYHRRHYRRSYRYVGAPCWYYGSCYRYRYYRYPRRYYHRHRYYYPRRGLHFYFRF